MKFFQSYFFQFIYLSVFLCVIAFFLPKKIYSQSTQELYKQGNNAFRQQDYTKAIELYNQAIINDKNFAPAYHNLGSVYYLLGEYDQAIQYFNNAIILNPKEAEAYNSRGALFVGQRKIKEAEKDLKIAMQLNPQSPKSYQLLGLICLAQNKKEEACKAWIQAQKLGDTETAIYLEKYCGIKNTIVPENKKVETEQKNTDKQPKPKTFEEFLQAGNNALEKRAYKDALSYFEKATQMNKKSADAFFGLGGAHHALANYDLACKAWKQAQSLGHQKATQMMDGVCDK